MKIKLILTIIITLFSIQLIRAQQPELSTSHDVIRLVSDANNKLNTIYHQRVLGKEKEQAKLQTAIYAANKELLSVRKLLTGSNPVRSDKLNNLQKQISSLQTALNSIDNDMSNSDLAKAVDDVKSKAEMLNRSIKNIKR